MKSVKFLLLIIALVLAISLCGCEFLFANDDFGNPYEDEYGSDYEGTENGESNDSGDHECNFVVVSEEESTCSVNGKKIYECIVCGESKEESLPKTNHTPVIIPSVEPTNSAPGKTESTYCGVCGYVIVKPQFVFLDDFLNPESYDGDYALNSLLSLGKADALKALYERIDAEADYFHISGQTLFESNTFATIDYSDLGLNSDEAIAVWSAYRIDHPLYYWFSSEITYTSKIINLNVENEYKDSVVRSNYNSEIYSKVETIVDKINSKTIYLTLLSLHDIIIYDADYAYESDGVTPSDATESHNIIGVLLNGFGVCESYAKTYQMLLNYCGIENIYAWGYAGEAHAWNLVKFEDGWYWCDLTWDDTPEFMFGVSHRYFMVTDYQDLSGQDGPWISSVDEFILSHTPDAKVDSGIKYTYALPSRSTTPIDSSDIILRDTFTVDNLRYAVIGYDSVQLVGVDSVIGGDLIIPSSVTYNDSVFKVVSIGVIKDGLLNIGPIVTPDSNITIDKIYIPESVSFIWDNALNIESVSYIDVDENSKYFASLSGVLFTKDKSILIKYPCAMDLNVYNIPDETKWIALGAFRMYYSNLDLKVEQIVLGENIKGAGIANYGYNYSENYQEYGNFEEDEWEKIESYLSGDAIIIGKNW